MRERLQSSNNANLILLNYDLHSMSVTNACVIPKQFFVLDIIKERKPLATTAKRAGWIGCNILLERVPQAGRVFLVLNGKEQSKDIVLALWKHTLFLRHEKLESRGWLTEIMRCVDAIGKKEFSLREIYEFEHRLHALHPHNRHVRQKIRQQLQLLRDRGYLEFVSRGHYRVRTAGH
jgi:type II restriction enzyme